MIDKKKEVDKSVIITVVIVIGLLEAIALLKGINGVLLTTIIGILAAMVGITIPSPITIKKSV